MKVTPGTWLTLTISAIAAAEAWFSGYEVYVALLAADGIAALSLAIALGWPRVKVVEFLLKWIMRPLFGVSLFMLGYPFAELIGDPSNQSLVNSFVCLGFMLAVVSVCSFDLERFLREWQDDVSRGLRTRIEALETLGKRQGEKIVELEGRFGALNAEKAASSRRSKMLLRLEPWCITLRLGRR